MGETEVLLVEGGFARCLPDALEQLLLTALIKQNGRNVSLQR